MTPIRRGIAAAFRRFTNWLEEKPDFPPARVEKSIEFYPDGSKKRVAIATDVRNAKPARPRATKRGRRLKAVS